MLSLAWKGNGGCCWAGKGSRCGAWRRQACTSPAKFSPPGKPEALEGQGERRGAEMRTVSKKTFAVFFTPARQWGRAGAVAARQPSQEEPARPGKQRAPPARPRR